MRAPGSLVGPETANSEFDMTDAHANKLVENRMLTGSAWVSEAVTSRSGFVGTSEHVYSAARLPTGT
jgi:hypothetical protein